MRSLLLIIGVLALGACAGGGRPAVMNAAQTIDPLALQAAAGSSGGDYRIGASDLLRVTVFQVADLTFDQIRVDATGNLHMPLIGMVPAAGRTPAELSEEIRLRLASQYLHNPNVNVTVSESASQKVTLDGAVTKPGVYTIQGRTTLMQAVAMAEGPVKTADLSSVVVFRTIGGRRMAAVFDLGAIRNGEADDPEIRGDDIIVVDASRLNSAFREVLSVLPALSIFAYY